MEILQIENRKVVRKNRVHLVQSDFRQPRVLELLSCEQDVKCASKLLLLLLVGDQRRCRHGRNCVASFE